jgi:hypothetical protein
MSHHTIPPLSEEFSQAELGDSRRTDRLMVMADAAAAAPGAGIPRQAGTEAALEATYRFLNNEDVGPEEVLDSHFRMTALRAAESGRVLVVHDTTKFTFGGEKLREGLARGSGEQTQGFFSHFSFCLTEDGKPLGTIALHSWARHAKSKTPRAYHLSQWAPDKEFARWHDGVDLAEERLHGHAREVVHVMDREGDCYELMADMLDRERRFVIRLCHDRRLAPGRATDAVAKLFDDLERAPVVMQREVALGARAKKWGTEANAKHPPRAARPATLSIRAKSVEIFIGNGAPAHLPQSLRLNAVEVREQEPPAGEEPVLWRIIATEPIETTDQIAAIVDIYRRRWTVEEFFKALKTGCQYEKLQLESAHALLVALAIHTAVAWRLLLLRWTSREMPEAPADTVLTAAQIAVLRRVGPKLHCPLPKHPTVLDALRAVARLGGHIKNNGAPGWLVLGRGFDKLLLLELGWLAAQESA